MTASPKSAFIYVRLRPKESEISKYKSTMTHIVVLAGHLCLDVIPTFQDGDELPTPGQLTQVGAAILATGGPVSNTGLALHILGVDTRLMGKVGDDAFGRAVIELIRARDPKLAEGVIVAPSETTSYSIVLNRPPRDRSFLHCSGANDTFRASDLNLDTIAQAALFHFGYPPIMAQMYANDGAELAEVFRTVKNLGVTTSLDMVMVARNSRAAQANWEEILHATLPYVDIFLPSIEEILLLLRPSEFDRLNARGVLVDQVTPTQLREFAELFVAWGAKIVGLKLGQRGLYLRTANADKLARLGRAAAEQSPASETVGFAAPRDIGAWASRELCAPIFKVEHLVGTTGSGDATIAGFLAALLAGCSPEDTLTFACAVGACNVEAADALSGLKSWDQTWARVKGGWVRVPLTIDDPAWKFNDTSRLWIGPADDLPPRR
jgi:sugar/nucleoside kinase (ribokinase family)